jgi:ABC-2 type transport system ATP-binding protein
VLELHDINRSFGDRHVLQDVSFTVEPGRLTGFVGANGAGKTTTMRIILGLLTADSGTVTLAGEPIADVDRRRFGYMPEERGLYPKMRVAEQIVYLARLHGIAQARAELNTARLLERLGLADRANAAVESLSLGNQQRAQIAAALVHEPDVLILDEPFSGLDPIAVEIVQSVLKEFAGAGTPVLFSSHQLDVVERLCDDLVVIADGAIRASGSRQKLREAFAGSRFELVTSSGTEWLADSEGISAITVDGLRAQFDADSELAAQNVLKRAIAMGEVTRFAPLEPTLAQIFREVIR